MDPNNAYHMDPVARQVGELHARRLGRVAGSRILEQRFFALMERYAAMAPMMKSTQDPQLVGHATRCNLELSGNPATGLPQAFEFLWDTYHQVYFATLNYNLVGARYLLTTAEVCMTDAVTVYNAVEASLVVLESWHRAFRLSTRYNDLLVALRSIDRDYEHLRNQWLAIDPMIREGARVRVLSVNTCVSAFEPQRGTAPQFLMDKHALDQSMGAITDAIGAYHFGHAEALLHAATEHYNRLGTFISNLGHAVRECQAIEIDVREEQAKSERKISSWMNSIRTPRNSELSGHRPYMGLQSRFQVGFNQYFNQPTFGNNLRNSQAPIGGQTQPAVRQQQPASHPTSNAQLQTDVGRDGGLDPILHYPKAISPRTMADMERMARYGPGESGEESYEAKKDSGYASGPSKR